MNELTTVETAELESYEAVIENGIGKFFEVGNALTQIREKKLYRREHETFEDYCQDKWGIGRNYASKLIGAAVVVENLGTIVPKPKNEAQVRPLKKLPPTEQKKVWEQAVVANEGKQPTAVQVETAVKSTILTTIPDKYARQLEGLPDDVKATVWKWATKTWGSIIPMEKFAARAKMERDKIQKDTTPSSVISSSPAATTPSPSENLSPNTAVPAPAASLSSFSPAVCDTCLVSLVVIGTADDLGVVCPKCGGSFCTNC